jgi:RNA recognition motif-containing protein
MQEVYVGNLLYSTTMDDVRELFAAYGDVYSVKLIAEREPGHPHAYAFIEMANGAANAAVLGLDRLDYMGRTLRVEYANGE